VGEGPKARAHTYAPGAHEWNKKMTTARGFFDCLPRLRGRRVTRPVLCLALVLAGACPARSNDLVEEPGFFRTVIGGQDVRLEGLVVKRADASGRLPIALITHGKPASTGKVLDVHATSLTGQARDLARRGWLAAVVVRRGYGQSDGPLRVAVSCRNPSFTARFAAEADDLSGALDFIARRPDADPTRMIAIGASAGGAAVAALSALNPKHLLGVVNVSGGLRMEACPAEDALVAAFRQLGAKSRVPNLWLYARNDSFFRPETVERMRTSFLDGGGDVKLVMFDPIGSDGHSLFGTAAGRQKWLMELDAFLRFRGLPTWQHQDVDALIKKVGSNNSKRGFFEGYVAAPSEKVLAQRAGGGYWYSAFGFKTVGEARNRALESCQQKRPGDPCAIVMENDRWVGGAMWGPAGAARVKAGEGEVP
jgi:dienelactone hydrolase